MKKIPTLFKRIFDCHKVVDVLPEITDGCEEAFLHGRATLKWDGSCCAVINGEFYKRYDAKNGKPRPDGAIKCQEEPDPITGHLPCWVKCDRNNPSDKWFWNAYDNTIDTFKNFIGRLPELSGTYEAVGKHFNGNPYQADFDYLLPHGIREVSVKRTFEGVKKFLAENYIEGIVFWLNNKPVCKIKRSDFGFEWNKKE